MSGVSAARGGEAVRRCEEARKFIRGEAERQRGVPDCRDRLHRSGLHGDHAISVGWTRAVSVNSRLHYLSNQAMI